MMRSTSIRERRLSWLLLALLPIVAAGIYLKGQRYDPHIFALDESLLEGPAAARAAWGLPPSVLALAPPAAGWHPDGQAETFAADALFQKIDGRADEYLTHGARGLQFVSFTDDRLFVDVFAYDMTTPAQAAAMLAAERPPQPAPLALGDEGYRAEASCFFRRDRYYVQVIASDSGAPSADASLNLAQQIDGAVRGIAAGASSR